ncbi:MAG: hypothetical protein ACYC8T_30770 [Myxococcaceae bacterium]
MSKLNVVAISMLLLGCSGGGGTGTPDGGGGGAGGGGGGADGGAGGGSGSISGTLFAPTGGTVQGSEVMACVPTATGECDAAKSVTVAVSAGGASAAFSIPNLPADSYYLIGGKDLNANDTLDVGDYLGGYLDGDGNWVPVTPPFTSAAIKMVVVPPTQAAAPPELVGTWGPTSDRYVIRADGTYDYVLVWMGGASNCVVYRRTDFTRSGRISVTGSNITFTPSEGTSTYLRCNGSTTTSLATPTPSAFTWRIAPNGTVSTLYLTDDYGERDYPKQ